MTMDVSRLGIVVESKGIDEARKALDGGNGRGGLYGAAEKTEKAVVKLTDSLSKMLTVNTSATTQAWTGSLQSLNRTVGQLTASLGSAINALNAIGPVLNNTAAASQRVANAHRQHAHHSGVIVNTLKAMTTAALAYMSVNFAMSIVKQADSWLMMTARLQNATGSMNNALVAQEQMFDLAQRLRVPLEDTVKLYTRLAPAVQRMGKDSNYAKDMVEGISTALQLSGANGAETSSVMLQLSQSFSSGVLNGAEFNAVAENGSVLMRALEAYTKKTTYELKKMGSEGKLSMETLGKAIQANLPMWREQFDRLPVTFEGAMQRIANAWTKAVGQLGEETGFNQRLSQGLRVIEEMIPGIARSLGNVFSSLMGWIDKNKDGLFALGIQIRELFADSWKVAMSFAEWVGNLAGASNSLEGLAKFMLAVRLTAAFVADLFSDIGRFIVRGGVFLVDYFIKPLYVAKDAIADINIGMGTFYAKIAEGSRAIGLGDMAKAFSENAKDSLNAGAESKRKYVDVLTTLQKMKGVLSDIDAKRATEGTYVDQVLKGEKNRTAELEAQKIMEAEIARIKALHPRKMDENWKIGTPGKAEDSKAATAAAVATRKYEDALDTLNAKLTDQQMLQKNLAKDGLGYDKITPGLKEVNRLTEELYSLVDKGAKEQEIVRVMTLRDKALEVSALETINERTLERLKLEEAGIAKQQTATNNVKEQALDAERKLAAYGLQKGAVEELELIEARRAVLVLEMAQGQRDLTANEMRTLELLKEQVGYTERLVAAKTGIGQAEAVKNFDKLFDARKAEKFGNVLAEGFGKAGKALGTLINAMGKYEARQAKITQGRKELNAMDKGSEAYAKRSTKLAEEEAESRIASYADMAGAAKGFFEEGSKGYKAMQAAEMTFRAFQMAMAVKAFLTESGFISAITSLFVGAKATETAAEVASVGPHVAAESAKQGSNAITALTSALAAPFPVNIAAFALVAGLLAAIGVGVGGGGGGGGGASLSAQRQKSQGTGTVMGDSDAKSESISKSLEIVSKNSDIALRYSSGMLSSLQNIEYSLTGATSGVIRSGTSVTGKGFESTAGISGIGKIVHPLGEFASKIPVFGGILTKMINTMYGTKTSLLDSGLTGASQSVADVLQGGFNVKGYQDIQTKKKMFGITYSEKSSTSTSEVDPAISREFGNIISGMVDSLASAAGALGLSGELVREKLAAVNIDIGKISLKDLSSEEIQKQLEAVFSAIGDKLSVVALPMMAAFQKAGEGLLETAVRVANGVEVASYELEKLGITAVAFQSLTNKSGDVGAEIVRQSILAQEAGAGITEIIKTMAGDAGTIAEMYKSLTGVRSSLRSLGLADEVTRDLIRAAGGLEALQSALESYTENFFTDAEQAAMKTSSLRKEFEKLGLGMPATKANFRSLVENLFASGASGQELATKVLLLADAFADLDSTTENLISSARDDLSEAYERESQALADVRDRFKEFADSLKEFKTALLTGDLSTLDVASKYQVEKARFEEVLNKARAGDEGAIDSFQGVATEFLNASRAMNASGSVYTSDFERVLAETDFLANLAGGKVSDAERQLAALDKQVATLITINESVLTVAQAIANLTALMATGSTGPTMGIMPVGPGAQIAQAPVFNSVSNDALVTELQALRTEVTALRADQAAQTQATIAANHDSNMQNAAAIVEGTADVASTISYAERATTKLA